VGDEWARRERRQLVALVLEVLATAEHLLRAPGRQHPALLVARSVLSLRGRDVLLAAVAVAVQRDLRLRLSAVLRQRLATVVRALHAGVAFPVLRAGLLEDERPSLPEALEDRVEGRLLVGAMHEGGVAGPVHLRPVADVDLGEAPDERVLRVDARRQAELAQRARQADGGHQDGLVRSALGRAESHVW
jgi:hypothetical protein